LAEVRDSVLDRLFQEKIEAKRKEYLAVLRAQSSIQVFLKEGEILGGPKAANEGQASSRRLP